MESLNQKIIKKLKILNDRRNSCIKEIELHKNNPTALVIHEQIELMRANDAIELLNDLLRVE